MSAGLCPPAATAQRGYDLALPWAARILGIGGGTTEIMNEIIAKLIGI